MCHNISIENWVKLCGDDLKNIYSSTEIKTFRGNLESMYRLLTCTITAGSLVSQSVQNFIYSAFSWLKVTFIWQNPSKQFEDFLLRLFCSDFLNFCNFLSDENNLQMGFPSIFCFHSGRPFFLS